MVYTGGVAVAITLEMKPFSHTARTEFAKFGRKMAELHITETERAADFLHGLSVVEG